MTAGKERLHTFIVIRVSGQRDRIIVWDTEDLTVGRAKDNDLTLDDAEVSRRHAIFSRENASFVVKDLNTSNGTFVNGHEVRTHTLDSEDVIKVGEVEMTYYQIRKNPFTLGGHVEYASQLKGFELPQSKAANAESTMLGLSDPLPGTDDDDFEVEPAGDFAYDLQRLDDENEEPSIARDLDLELEQDEKATAGGTVEFNENLEPVDGGPDPETDDIAPELAPEDDDLGDEDDFDDEDDDLEEDEDFDPVRDLQPPEGLAGPAEDASDDLASDSPLTSPPSIEPVAEIPPDPPSGATEVMLEETNPDPDPPEYEFEDEDDDDDEEPVEEPVAEPIAATEPPAPPPIPTAGEAREAGESFTLNLEIEGLSAELRTTLASLLGKVIELPSMRIRLKDEDLG